MRKASIDQWSILAGLRFLLASIVAVNHLEEYTGLGFLGFVPRFGAFEAILGFLLISGYSVSVSYLKEPEGFVVRRLKRLYPIYLASILITLAVSVFVVHEKVFSIRDLVFNALFLNQLFTRSSFVGPAWSLSLEFWLYCLAPALLTMRPGWTRALAGLSFASYIIYTVGRTLLHLPYYSNVGFGGNLVLLSFIWICGLRLARQPENPGPVMRDIGAIFVCHIALAAGIQFFYRMKHHATGMFLTRDSMDFVLQSVTLCMVYCVFATVVVKPRDAPRRSRLLRFLGDVSYPLYLIHVPIFTFLAATGLRSALAYYVISIAASAALYWSVDFYSKRRHLQLVPHKAIAD